MQKQGPCLRMVHTYQPLSLHSQDSRTPFPSLCTLGYLERSEGICPKIASAASRPGTDRLFPERDDGWQSLYDVFQRHTHNFQKSRLISEYWLDWTPLGWGDWSVS
jgi:hypothetical protein